MTTKPSNPSATDETGASPVDSAIVAEGAAKEAPRDFLRAVRRNLSEEELASPAARRFLIAEIERLDEEVTRCRQELSSLRERYDVQKDTLHSAQIELAKLKEKTGLSIKNELLSYLTLTIGAAGLGAAPSYLALPNSGYHGTAIMILSAILVLGGLILRRWK